MRTFKVVLALGSIVAFAAVGTPTVARAEVIVDFPDGKTIRYGETRDHSITVYRARSRTAAPVVLLFGEPRPRFGEANRALTFLIGGLIDRGVAVVGINLPAKSLADDVDNVGRALALVKSRSGDDRLDLSRIAVLGHRSGAHLAALVATDPTYLRSASLPFEGLRAAAIMDGGIIENADPAQPRLSPITHLPAPNAPMFLFATVNPNAGRPRHIDELADGLRATGTRVMRTTMVAGDGLTTGSPSDRTTREFLAYLLAVLK